jgi:hypothetical protein
LLTTLRSMQAVTRVGAALIALRLLRCEIAEA